MEHAGRMARAFDELADGYDDESHDRIAGALIDFVGSAMAGTPTGAVPGPAAGVLDGAVADVACGTGALALSIARRRPATAAAVLAIDISAGMVAAGRARAERLGLAGAIDWRVGPAVPLPVADASLDLILCASSLHFLGAAALADWRRALRPGGRVGFTLPVASAFHPGGVFADLVAADLPLPETTHDALESSTGAGFTGAGARMAAIGGRRVMLVTAVR